MKRLTEKGQLAVVLSLSLLVVIGIILVRPIQTMEQEFTQVTVQPDVNSCVSQSTWDSHCQDAGYDTYIQSSQYIPSCSIATGRTTFWCVRNVTVPYYQTLIE